MRGRGNNAQALLITRHMLFVGFSLTDDNFHRIVDDVRKAPRGAKPREVQAEPFGTALQLSRDDLLAELWREDLAIVSMAGPVASDHAGNARRLEIFLDAVLAESTQGVTPLLDPAYDALLSEPEREVRDALQYLDATLSEEARSTPAGRLIAELLGRLGAAPG